MNTFGISDRSTQLIQQTLATFTAINRAVIFGSRAKGNYKKGSDIDLAIYGDNLQRETANALSAELNEEQPIPYFVDVLAPQYLNDPELLEHIERVGTPFYQKKGSNE